MWRLIPLYFLVAAAPLLAKSKYRQVEIISEELETFSRADGTGLYWDIFDLIFLPEGIEVKKTTLPYARAQKKVQQKESDAIAAAYLNEFTPAVYPQQHFDVDNIDALFKRGTVTDWHEQASLKGSVGWMRSYNFGAYLAPATLKAIRPYEVDSRLNAVKMLEKGRLDFLIDAREELEAAITRDYKGTTQFEIKPVMSLKLYLAFAVTQKGRFLADLYDRRIKMLIADGTLKALFVKWKVPYPFPDQA